METLLIAVGAAIFYIIAYHTYGRWLARKIFKLDPNASVPSIELEDGSDYVPTKKGIVFGHHFTSIAGTGPIVGPALAVIWGWVPALLWVLFGSVLIGAIHDFGSLIISMRNKGQTVGDIAGRVLHPRARILFLLILFVALTIVLAIFGMVIAAVFRLYPQAIFPCILQIPIALWIGVFLHRRGSNLLIPSILALLIMYLSVAFGDIGIIGAVNAWLAQQSNMWWVIVLLSYSAISSITPVWTLLQPRDYINSLQLLSALLLILIGLTVASFIGGAPTDENGTRHALEIVAPAVESDFSLKALPSIAPFLFITIACGAISGFHCLVSSGTSSKQLCNERDAQFVGFGSMLTEGMLAVIVILACVAGLGLGAPALGGENSGQILFGENIWDNRYGSWASSKGLGAKIGAFVDGSANLIKALGIPAAFATALMGVFVASFAATTLDTACRLQRYVIQELFGSLVRKNKTKGIAPILTNKYSATILAVSLAAILAAIPVTEGGKMGAGGLILWPLFGATNQLLGGLAFLVIIFWMKRRKLPTWFVILPAIFMLILPAWALIHQVFIGSIDGGASWFAQKKWLLVSISLGSIILEVWLIVEAVIAWKKIRRSQLKESNTLEAT